MYTYELITPSDPITFNATDDKVAYCVTVLVAEGKAGCKRKDDTGKLKDLGTMLFFCSNPEKEIIKVLGCKADVFLKEHKDQVCAAFASFAYTNLTGRIDYDTQLSEIASPSEQEAFKIIYENQNRSSITQWVKYAWQLSKKIK